MLVAWALRDEGAAYHYLPGSEYAEIPPAVSSPALLGLGGELLLEPGGRHGRAVAVAHDALVVALRS